MSTVARRDVFQAIADPTRRDILGLLVKKPQNLNTIAERFTISRPAISRHVKILSECGLLLIRQQGRERYCEARLSKLHEVSAWVEQYKKFWDNKLDALENFLNESAKQKKSIRKSIKSKR